VRRTDPCRRRRRARPRHLSRMAWRSPEPTATGRGGRTRREVDSMIASVRGAVASVGLDHVVVEVGGVGMLVHTTPADAAALRPGQEATLATTLVVREDSLTLYGFGETAQRDLFEQVQTVSGVGPRLALA